MSTVTPTEHCWRVLPTEDRNSYERLGRHLLEAWKPSNGDGCRLVKLLQDTQWRLDRLTSIDFNLLTLGIAEQIDSIDKGYEQPLREALAQASAYRANARVLDQLQRHEARLRRLYDQTRAELTLLQPAAPQPAQSNDGFVPAGGFVPNILETAPQTKPAKLPKMPKFSGPMKEVHRKQWLRKHRIAA